MNKENLNEQENKHCKKDGCKHEHKHNHDNCDENCDCGCQEGKECTCEHDQCNCDENCDCGCQEGKDCTCEHDHCDCEHDHCDDEHCDCGCEHEMEGNPEYKKYEQAFIQLEDALIKVDKELEETKLKAKENEHLAISIKKDFERYKARVAGQQEEMKANAVSSVATKLIPILDNFEQALSLTTDKNVQNGFKMIENMLQKAVFELGIEEIKALGEEFDPKLHNAISKKKTNDKKLDNKISNVFQKGYKMLGENGKVIRHSTVEIYLQD